MNLFGWNRKSAVWSNCAFSIIMQHQEFCENPVWYVDVFQLGFLLLHFFYGTVVLHSYNDGVKHCRGRANIWLLLGALLLFLPNGRTIPLPNK